VFLLWLDVDDFKVVNDSLGHHAGDQLLVAIGERLRACLPGDTPARMGGDEFTVLLADVSTTDDAIRVAERVTAELAAPFTVAGHQVTAHASSHASSLQACDVVEAQVETMRSILVGCRGPVEGPVGGDVGVDLGDQGGFDLGVGQGSRGAQMAGLDAGIGRGQRWPHPSLWNTIGCRPARSRHCCPHSRAVCVGCPIG
jgi:hypothetical protein